MSRDGGSGSDGEARCSVPSASLVGVCHVFGLLLNHSFSVLNKPEICHFTKQRANDSLSAASRPPEEPGIL